MIELDDAKTLFSFDKDLEPVLKVPSGETVRIRTKDCFGNQLQGPEDQLSEIDWEAITPATGPIYVEGAVAGGTLKVHIDNIELDAQTSSCTGKDEGVCGDRFSDWATHFCKVEDGKVVWDERLSIPLAPMIGVIGVAPKASRSTAERRASMAATWTTPPLPQVRRCIFPLPSTVRCSGAATCMLSWAMAR